MMLLQNSFVTFNSVDVALVAGRRLTSTELRIVQTILISPNHYAVMQIAYIKQPFDKYLKIKQVRPSCYRL